VGGGKERVRGERERTRKNDSARHLRARADDACNSLLHWIVTHCIDYIEDMIYGGLNLNIIYIYTYI
jgi:hypothetical protein